MEFKITLEQKYLLIISAAFILLGAVVKGVWNITGAGFDIILVKNLIHAAAYLVIMFILMAYFKFYKLNTLYVLTLILTLHGLLLCLFQLCNLFLYADFTTVKKIINIPIGLIKIAWLVCLAPLRNGKYASIDGLYKYGIATIVAFLISVAISYVMAHIGNFIVYSLYEIIMVLPFVFIIDFALKLKIKTGPDDMDRLKM